MSSYGDLETNKCKVNMTERLWNQGATKRNETFNKGLIEPNGSDRR